MDRLPLRGVLLLLFLLAAWSVAAAGEPAPTVPPKQIVALQVAGEDERAMRPASSSIGQTLEPRDTPAEELLEAPKYRSQRPLFYAARFGDGKDCVYCVVLDESKGTGRGYDTLYLDADHDRRIDPARERFAIRVGDAVRADSIRVRLAVSAGGVTAPYFVNLAAVQTTDDAFPIPTIRIHLRDGSFYRGQAAFGRKTCGIAVLDLNGNGLYNDVERGTTQGDGLFVDLDGDGRFSLSFPYGGFTQIAGQWYSIVVSPDGGRLEVAAAQPALGKVEAPPHVIGARLVSPGQTLTLDFQDGADRAVAGVYRVQGVQLLAESGWALAGTFPDGSRELTVREGQTARLKAGLPLRVEPQVVADEDRTLRVHLRITGTGGEVYTWSTRNGPSSKAGFEIYCPSGICVASESFEYG
jgi:hypothetical protein